MDINIESKPTRIVEYIPGVYEGPERPHNFAIKKSTYIEEKKVDIVIVWESPAPEVTDVVDAGIKYKFEFLEKLSEGIGKGWWLQKAPKGYVAIIAGKWVTPYKMTYDMIGEYMSTLKNNATIDLIDSMEKEYNRIWKAYFDKKNEEY